MSDTRNSKVDDTRTSENEHKKKITDVITTNNDTNINCSTLMSNFKALLLIYSSNDTTFSLE